jgi:hypothetical protein
METINQIKRSNWKNNVRWYYNGNTLTQLKDSIRMWREKADRDYEDFLIRNSDEYKRELARIYFS